MIEKKNPTLEINLNAAKEIAVKDKGLSSRQESQLSKEESITILNNLKEEKKLPSIENALVLVTGLAQVGGSNSNANVNAKFTHNGVTITAMELKNSIKKITKNGTIRQLCRALADEIAEIAMAMKLEGDLARTMRQEHSEITPEEAIWCSNFQTNNPNCPDKVKEFLKDNYRKRFPK